jgi:LPS export ABC transporter protein LptC
MNKKFAFFTIALLLAAVVATWMSLRIVKNTTKQHVNEPKNPDAIAVNVTYTKMDKNGQIHSVINTPKLIHYPYLDSSTFQNPDIIINNSHEQPWHITANNGNSRHGTDVIQLFGNVKLKQNAGSSNKKLAIMTNAATAYLHDKYIVTDQPITILRPGNVLKAKANTIKYYPDKGIAILQGKGEITQGGNKLNGPYMVYNLNQKAIAVTSEKKNRATIVLQP